MKKQWILLVVASLLLAAISLGRVEAEDSSIETLDERHFTTLIAYQNVSEDPVTITFTFYGTITKEDGNEETIAPLPQKIEVPKHASGSFYLADIRDEFEGPFKGGVTYDVADSDAEKVVITLIQMPVEIGDVGMMTYNRPITNGFIDGENTFYIGTYLKNRFNDQHISSVLSIQNADTKTITVMTRFYSMTEPGIVYYTPPEVVLKQGETMYYRASDLVSLGETFNGSAKIEATGKIVASVMELAAKGDSIVDRYAVGFEGLGTKKASSVVYVPTALCNYCLTKDCSEKATTFYAVQNVGDEAAEVIVEYEATYTAEPERDSWTILPGGKKSFKGCKDTSGSDFHHINDPDGGYKGSATIYSFSDTNGNGEYDSEDSNPPIIVIGKATSNLGLGTSFTGEIVGNKELYIPYVRWAEESEFGNSIHASRTYIAIQNIGENEIDANDITVTYYDVNGKDVLTHTNEKPLKSKEKFNSNPKKAGKNDLGLGYGDIEGGGSVIITCEPNDCLLIATARTSWQTDHGAKRFGEDVNAFTYKYGGGPIPTATPAN